MATATISPPELWSMNEALADILDRLEIPTRQHVATIGRAKRLLSCGLLPNHETGRGLTVPLSRAQYRRLLWGTLLTTCDIAPAIAARALSVLSDEDLAGCVLHIRLPSKFHRFGIDMTVMLPTDGGRYRLPKSSAVR